MSGLRRIAAPARARLRGRLSPLLADLPEPLHAVVEQVAGLEGEIDVVARTDAGRAVAVLLAAPGDDLAAFAELLAQCHWLAPRLADWLKLDPRLAVSPELGVAGLLLAEEFDPRTLEAARALPHGSVMLARLSAFDWEGQLQLALEPVFPREGDGAGRSARRVEAPPGGPSRPLAEVGPEVAALESRFRTSLRDDELGLPRRPRVTPRG